MQGVRGSNPLSSTEKLRRVGHTAGPSQLPAGAGGRFSLLDALRHPGSLFCCFGPWPKSLSSTEKLKRVGHAANPSQMPVGAGDDFPFWMPVGHPGSLFILSAFGRIALSSTPRNPAPVVGFFCAECCTHSTLAKSRQNGSPRAAPKGSPGWCLPGSRPG